jgi:C1A family cysteine protease
MPPKVKSDAIIKMQAITLAASIDWRNISNKNYVQSMKDQGSCGSCWAFASVSALESYTALATGQLPNLSEQNLVDCSYVGKDGCNGGANPDAFNYVLRNGGIASKANYPYVSGTSGTVSI